MLEEICECVVRSVLVVVFWVVQVDDAYICVGIGRGGIVFDSPGELHRIELLLPIILMK